jgi:hypothetical protein
VSELVLPPGVEVGTTIREYPAPPEGKGVIVNETDLPDEIVQTYIEENASVIGLSANNSFSTYQATGNLMTRPKWRPPSNIIEEIVMARELADRDSDVAPTIGMLQALAFGEGMRHSHRDEVTIAQYDKIAHKARILGKLKEMYREWLIAGQVTTATIFEPAQISFTPMNADRQRSRNVWIPRVAIIPAEQIRVLGNDIFGTAPLAYRPFSGRQEAWLMEYFSKQTSAARKREMQLEDPILTTLLTEEVAWEGNDMGGAEWVYGDPRDPIIGHYVYRMNEHLVHRSTIPKGQQQHPRPMLTRNMPMLEAKRLLALMDYSLLEAGANFLIVAKKGTDARPALPEEVANLRDTIVRASRSGVMIGDHRLSIEIITPKMDELLNAEKHKLISRSIVSALLRAPDWANSDVAGGQEVLTTTEIISRVVEADRFDIATHLHDFVYELTSQRNDDPTGPAHIWFPKVVLQGLQFFTELILGLRDRGDIPRSWGVEYAGFDWNAAVQQRKLEVSSGDDKVMAPAAVPFSSPNAGPQNNGGAGRPPGGGGNKPAPGTGKRTIQKNAGETIKAMWDGEDGPIFRAGEQTYALLESYLDVSTPGRITASEAAALARIAENAECDIIIEGAFTVVPVNAEYAIGDVHALRLSDGSSVLLGRRDGDGAIVARAFSFREPRYDRLAAEEAVLRWGFSLPPEPAE